MVGFLALFRRLNYDGEFVETFLLPSLFIGDSSCEFVLAGEDEIELRLDIRMIGGPRDAEDVTRKLIKIREDLCEVQRVLWLWRRGGGLLGRGKSRRGACWCCLRDTTNGRGGTSRGRSLRMIRSEVPGQITRRAADVVPQAEGAITIKTSQERRGLKHDRIFALGTLHVGKQSCVALLAGRRFRRLGSDTDQKIANDFRVRNAGLPEVEKLGMFDVA